MILWPENLGYRACELATVCVVPGMGHEARPEELDSVLKFLKSVL